MSSPSVTEAATVPANSADAVADFENFLFGEDEAEEQDDTNSSDDSEQEGDEADLELEDEDEGEQDDEPEAPAIDAPASLNASEKAVFAQLPKEAQEAWAASETRRNSQVQEATTKASQAQREAEARAANADAEAKAQYGQQLERFVSAFEPQRPDPRHYQDQLSYLTAKATYDDAKAQHDALVQQARSIQTEANTEAQAAFVQQRDRELMTIPEIANPDTREATLQRAFGTAEKLGFDVAELAQGAEAKDIKALLTIADKFDKADKYDAAMSRKMQRVRSAKGKTLRPNAAPQEQSRAAAAAKAWERTTSTRNKQDQASAFADYLEATGHL